MIPLTMLEFFTRFFVINDTAIKTDHPLLYKNKVLANSPAAGQRLCETYLSPNLILNTAVADIHSINTSVGRLRKCN